MKVDEEDAKESRDKVTAEEDPTRKKELELMMVPQNTAAVLEQMNQVQTYVKDGAKTFLKEEYTKLTIFCVFFAAILCVAVDQNWKKNEAGDDIKFPMTAT